MMAAVTPVAGFIPSSLDGDLAARFAEARHVQHRTWFELAADLLAAVEAEAPDEPLVAAYGVLTARLLGHDAEVRIARTRNLAETRPEPERTLALAIAAIAAGTPATALDLMQRFLEQRPDDPYARHKTGSLLMDLDRQADAIDALEALVADCPAFVPALNHLGLAYVQAGEIHRGLVILRRLVVLDPDNPSARDSLADALEAAGDPEAALGQLARAVLLEPRFAYAWRHAGDLLAGIGDRRVALLAYRAARESSAVYGSRFSRDLDDRLVDTAR
jgi:predicted Zn-dependent protease